MDDSGSTSSKTVPPLKIKNVRALQTLHLSDESDTGSNSDDQNLMIDEVYELNTSDETHDEMMLIVDEPRLISDNNEEDDLTTRSSKSSNRLSITSSDECTTNLQPTPLSQQSACSFTHSSKGNRRKSHHVPKQVGDVVFEETTILTVTDAEQTAPNRNLMKNIAMLKSCINYVLEQQELKPIAFKHNFEKASKLIEQYNQIKEDKLGT
ncbi:uncharacterized protein LOC131427404 isoform X2 [Malaya genurostris]|nr:uncharacterized protein LOC131427404 isoform X2 [Malaya genurostris]